MHSGNLLNKCLTQSDEKGIVKSNLLNELLCIIYFNAIDIIESFLIVASKRQYK